MRSLLPLALLCGCANFSVQPARSADAPGLHFFVPKPYVLFWWERELAVKAGTLVQSLVPRFEVLYLPDPSQRYAVTQHAFLSKGDFAFRIRDGWMLESVNGALDTTEALRTLREAATTAIDRGIPRVQAIGEQVPEQALPPPVLFEPVWDEAARTYRFKPVNLEGFGVPAPVRSDRES